MSPLDELQALLQTDDAHIKLTQAKDTRPETVIALLEAVQRILSIKLSSRAWLSPWCGLEVEGVCKDHAKAEQLKAQAADLFKRKSFSRAAGAYIQAYRSAAVITDEQKEFASRLLSNRAICLLQLRSSHAGSVLVCFMNLPQSMLQNNGTASCHVFDTFAFIESATK